MPRGLHKRDKTAVRTATATDEGIALIIPIDLLPGHAAYPLKGTRIAYLVRAPLS